MSHSSNLTQLPPLQYKFSSRWIDEVMPLMSRPNVAGAFEDLKSLYIRMMSELLEAGDLGDGEEGRFYFQSRVFEAEARYRNYHWLRETFEADQLAELTLVIAQELEPYEVWDIVETDDVHSVVSNRSRSMVFDLKLHDRLSAAESLLYAENKISEIGRISGGQLAGYLDEKIEKERAVLKKLESNLSRWT